MMGEVPRVMNIKRHAGIAGQFAVSASVAYPGEDAETVTFVGSTFGGPVVMVLPSGAEIFVTDPGRHGEFGTAWVERFFGGAA